MSSARPIVIGGCGRSGTTLLRVMLDSHPSICCGPESGLFLPWPVTRGRVSALADRFDLPAGEVMQLRQSSGSQAEFVDRFFASYCRRTGKPRWAEKTPRNVRVLAFIFDRFPEARFVHVIRDGRDVACSLRTHPRHKRVGDQVVQLNTWNPFDQCVRRWVDDVTAGLSWEHRPTTFEVRYEDLILRPEPTLRNLLEWLDEPWNDAVLRYHEVTEQGSRDPSRFLQNPEATAPPYASSVGRWRFDMSPADAELFKRRAGELLSRLGYSDGDDWYPESTEQHSSEPAVEQ